MIFYLSRYRVIFEQVLQTLIWRGNGRQKKGQMVCNLKCLNWLEDKSSGRNLLFKFLKYFANIISTFLRYEKTKNRDTSLKQKILRRWFQNTRQDWGGASVQSLQNAGFVIHLHRLAF